MLRLFSLQLLFAVAVAIAVVRLGTSTHHAGSPRRLIVSIVVVVVAMSSVMIRIIVRIIGTARIVVVVANLSRKQRLHWINVLGFLVMNWRTAAVLLRD